MQANARLIDAGSGWHMADSGSILSSHSYDQASVPNCTALGSAASLPSDSRGHYALPHCAQHVLFNSEFGGLCLAPSAIGLPEWFDRGHERFFGGAQTSKPSCTPAGSDKGCGQGTSARAGVRACTARIPSVG